MTAEQTFFAAFVALGLIAALIDAVIPNKSGTWKADAASAQDVARIMSGGKPAGEPRHCLKLTLLLVAVLTIMFVLGR